MSKQHIGSRRATRVWSSTSAPWMSMVTLEPVARVQAALGKTLAHIELTRDGRFALTSLL